MGLNNKLSIDFDDDDKDYHSFSEFLSDNTQRMKSKTANDISKIGDDLLREIEIKKAKNEIRKLKLIRYILKRTKDKFSEDELKSYSIEDVREIYDELNQTQTQSKFMKFIHFIFNIE